MRNYLLLMFLLAFPHFAAVAVASEDASEQATSIEYASPAAALEALRNKAGVTLREENDWYVIHDPSEQTFWSITQPSNPAHPSAVKRTLVQTPDGVSMQMGIMCGASKKVCDDLVKTFQKLNAELSQRVREQEPKQPD